MIGYTLCSGTAAYGRGDRTTSRFDSTAHASARSSLQIPADPNSTQAFSRRSITHVDTSSAILDPDTAAIPATAQIWISWVFLSTESSTQSLLMVRVRSDKPTFELPGYKKLRRGFSTSCSPLLRLSVATIWEYCRGHGSPEPHYSQHQQTYFDNEPLSLK